MFRLCCSQGAMRRQRYPAQSNLNADGGGALLERRMANSYVERAEITLGAMR
jgi:hypothetical protein